MKILIIGGSGRLGRVLNRILLEEKYTTIPIGSKELDLKGEDVVGRIIGYTPDYIIHAAAITNVDECEKNPDLAYNINAHGTEKVASAALKLKVPLLYISSDYVFDGDNPPYSEDDELNPVNVYGKSKLDGEYSVKRLPSSVILRVSWLFGPVGNDFVDLILRADEPISVIGSQISKPTCTIDISYAIKNLIEKGVSGVYHFANPPAVTRLEWAKDILCVNKIRKRIKELSWSNLNKPAKRPLNSTLFTEKYEKEFGGIRSWNKALREILNG